MEAAFKHLNTIQIDSSHSLSRHSFFRFEPFCFFLLLNELNWIHNNVHFIRNGTFSKADNKQLFASHLMYSSEENIVFDGAIMVSNKTSNFTFYLHLCGLTVAQFCSIEIEFETPPQTNGS